MSGPLDAYDDTRPNSTTDDAGLLAEIVRNIKTEIIQLDAAKDSHAADIASVTSGLAAQIANITQLTVDMPKYKEWELATVQTITNSTPFPANDTVPLISGGTEVFSESYSAENAASYVRIGARLCGACSAGVFFQAAIFQGTTCVGAANIYANGAFVLEFHTKPVAVGVTTPTDYSIRVGVNGGTNVVLNSHYGSLGNRLFGGAMSCGMSIEEIQPTP